MPEQMISYGEHEKAMLEEIENRDRFEDVVTRMAEALGCQEEWSNLHDHCECVFEHIAGLDRDRRLAAYAESVLLPELDALQRLRDATDYLERDKALASFPEGYYLNPYIDQPTFATPVISAAGLARIEGIRALLGEDGE